MRRADAVAGLGYRSISMSPAAIGPVKAMLTELPLETLAAHLDEALAHPNAAKLYIDFVLSEEGQTLLSPVAEVPARKGVETTPAGLLTGMELYPVRPEAFERFNEYQQSLRHIFGAS